MRDNLAYDLSWQEDAKCGDGGAGLDFDVPAIDDFFIDRIGRISKDAPADDPKRLEAARLQAAKDFCWGARDGYECPVRETCLAFAIETAEPFGIWGGMTAEERTVFVRKKKEEAERARPRRLRSV